MNEENAANSWVKLQSSFCGVSFLIKFESCEWEREILQENWWEVNWEKGWKKVKLGREEDHQSGALQGKRGRHCSRRKEKWGSWRRGREGGRERRQMLRRMHWQGNVTSPRWSRHEAGGRAWQSITDGGILTDLSMGVSEVFSYGCCHGLNCVLCSQISRSKS